MNILLLAADWRGQKVYSYSKCCTSSARRFKSIDLQETQARQVIFYLAISTLQFCISRIRDIDQASLLKLHYHVAV
jgi:hypothetical protein